MFTVTGRILSGLTLLVASWVIAEETVTPISVPAAAEADAPPPVVAADVAPTAGAAVTVDGVELSTAELTKRVDAALKQGGASWPEDMMDAVRAEYEKEYKDLFVIRTVLLNEAQRLKVMDASGDIDAKVARLTARGDSAEAIAAEHGLTVDELKNELTTDGLIETLIQQEVESKIEIADEELKAFFEANQDAMDKGDTVRASHILVKVEGGDGDELKKAKREKIEGLRTQLLEGADFAELARANSDCPSSEKGGDLGDFGRGQMVKPFEDAAFSQELNAIGEIVETDFGFHIVKVTEKQAAGAVNFDDMKEDIRMAVLRNKRDVAVRDYIAGLRAKATITGIEVTPAPAFDLAQ